MSVTPLNVQQAQKQYFEALKDGQKAVIDSFEFWSNALESSMPRTVTRRSSDQLPAPKLLVENTFAFAERLIAAQKEFALALVDAVGKEVA